MGFIYNFSKQVRVPTFTLELKFKLATVELFKFKLEPYNHSIEPISSQTILSLVYLHSYLCSLVVYNETGNLFNSLPKVL